MSETILQEIMKLVCTRENLAAVPYSAAYTKGRWWVYIEMNSPHRTFDFETKHEDRMEALKRALIQLKRELR